VRFSTPAADDFLGGPAMFSILSTSEFTQADSVRLRRIERKLDRILSQLGIAPDDESVTGLSDAVRRLADAGKKVEAIKAYRDETGAGLREAKEIIDGYMR
jgi:ribosomal protein L7/L12